MKRRNRRVHDKGAINQAMTHARRARREWEGAMK